MDHIETTTRYPGMTLVPGRVRVQNDGVDFIYSNDALLILHIECLTKRAEVAVRHSLDGTICIELQEGAEVRAESCDQRFEAGVPTVLQLDAQFRNWVTIAEGGRYTITLVAWSPDLLDRAASRAEQVMFALAAPTLASAGTLLLNDSTVCVLDLGDISFASRVWTHIGTEFEIVANADTASPVRHRVPDSMDSWIVRVLPAAPDPSRRQLAVMYQPYSGD